MTIPDTMPAVDEPSSATALGRPVTGWARPYGAWGLVGLAICMALFLGPASIVPSHGQGKLPDGSNHRVSAPDSYLHWFALQAIRAGQDPYSPEVTRATQIALRGAPQSTGEQAFVYAVPALLWYLPMLGMDLPTAEAYARAIALLALPLVLVLTLQLAGLPLRPWLVVGAAASLASMTAIYDLVRLGQNTSLALALATGAALLYRRRAYAWAGLLMAVAMVKPQHVLILGLGLGLHAVWRQERRRFLVAAMAAGALQLGASVLLAPGWLPRWLERLAGYGAYNESYLSAALVGQTRLVPIIQLAVVLPVLAVWWRHRRDAAAGGWYTLAVSGGLVASMVAFTASNSFYNLLLLWPALVLLLFGPEWAPHGFTGQFARVPVLITFVGTPLLAGAAVLSRAFLSAPAQGTLLPMLILLVAIFSLYQGLLLALWTLEQTMPARLRAWRPSRSAPDAPPANAHTTS